VAAFSPDGRLVVTGTTDAADGVRVWDLDGARVVTTIRDNPGRVLGACFDARGERLLVTNHDDASARIFDARAGTLVAALQGHTSPVHGAAFSVDGRRVVTGSHDGTIRSWDAATGRNEWQAKAADRVQFVDFCPGDTVVAGTYRNFVHFLDGASGKPRRQFGGRSGTLLQVAYHPGRGLVATRSSDAAARVWSVSTGEEVFTIPAPDRGFRHLAFSAGGERLYTLAEECDLRAWPLDPLAAATAWKPRTLTPQEHHRFEIGTPEERREHAVAWNTAWIRRNLAAADRALKERPQDWRVRSHSIELLNACLGHALPLGEREELQRIEQLLREAARDPHADWIHLAAIAEAQRQAGRDLDALQTLERAIRKPHAGPEVVNALVDLRTSWLPDLATFDSIDAALESASENLIGPGAAWRLFRGRSEPSPGREWTQPGFDDAAWEEGASGFHYGDGGRSANGNRGTALEDMKGRYTTLYLRRKVVLADPGRWSALVLSIRADDGFVAYVDGEEVGRQRAGPGGVRMPFGAVADAAAPEPAPAYEIRLPVPPAGSCAIAIQGLNHTADSSDFSLVPELRGEIRPEALVLERGRDLLAAVQKSSMPGAAARAAYLEGRLLEIERQPAEALVRFDAAAQAASPARPEPHLRLAGCLEKVGRALEAEGRLRSALALGGEDSERLWDRWIALCFGHLGLEASAVLSRLPPLAAEGALAEPGSRLRVLLEALAADGAVRINCGGDAHAGADGARWLADCFFTGGYRYFGDRFGGANGPFTGEILGTEDDALFRTERWFPGEAGKAYGYAIPLPAGRWRIVLHFAEILEACRQGCGRKFDVLVEGRVAAADFEPAAAGFATASSLTHEVEVRDGQLELEFPARAGRMQPKVSAIEVRRIEGSNR
jgi:tetratricopeptide (TPR) repeat protein